MYSICITTFSKRFNFIEKLVSQIRKYTPNDILISVNGDYNQDFNEEYRKNILSLCLNFEKIYPIFFPEQRGLAKLWNTMAVHNKQDWCLMLNDDIEIASEDVFNLFCILADRPPDIFTINGSFSHFIVHKKCLDELRYFDERLLGFGEEDGDIVFRYIEKYGKMIQSLGSSGLTNHCSPIRDENIQPGIWKYTKFNREFCLLNENKKYTPDSTGIAGMFSHAMKKTLTDEIQYPYEQFFQANKHKL